MNHPTGTLPDAEAVVRLTCPVCSGKLNLRRKHIGLAGACVHCKTPVKAVEQGSEIILVSNDSDAVPQSREEAPVQVPPPLQENREPVAETPPALSVEPGKDSDSFPDFSSWGSPENFPGKEPNPGVLPPLESSADKGFNPQDSGFEKNIVPKVAESEPKKESDSLSLNLSNGIDSSGHANGIPTATGQPAEEESKTLFGSSKPSTDNLFGDLEKPPAVQPGWGIGGPSQSHASMSPFSTGSAESKPGFAETLFRDVKTGEADQKYGSTSGLNSSPVSEPASVAPPATPGSGFGPYESSKLGASEMGELPPMSKEQEEEFAKGMRSMHQSRRSPWMKRLLRLVIFGAILGGAGYAAMTFLPQEKVEHFKGAVNEWLAPAKSMLNSLPFGKDKGESGEEGTGGIKIDAIEGLKTFSNEYDDYQKQAADQIGTQVEEGPLKKRMPEVPFGLGGKAKE